MTEFNVQHEVLQVDHTTQCTGIQNRFHEFLITIPSHSFVVFTIPVIQHAHSHFMGISTGNTGDKSHSRCRPLELSVCRWS